jgi:hypothetical protein
MATTETEYEGLLKLYELAIDEEHYYLDAHQDGIAFYSGISSALVTGIGIGLFQASEWYHFALLCVGPVLIFAVSTIAVGGTLRKYQRFLETITVRAKIEQELGLTITQPSGTNAPDSYWQSEPIIPHRHIGNRRKYESSEAFINAHATMGYHFWATRLFRFFQWLSVLMFLGLLSLAVCKGLWHL